MATMSRKLYIAVAEILKPFANEMPQTTYEDLVNEFGEWFQADNANFDFARFETACGVDEIGVMRVN